MKILYICGDDPSLTGCGTQQRTHFLYQALKELGDVTVAIPQKGRRLDFIPNLFRGFTKVARWPFSSESRVRERLKIGDKKFDIVVCRYMQNASEFAAWKLGPLYLDVDDLPSQAFHIDEHRIPSCLRWLSALVVRWWQGYVFKKCAGVWVVKKEDEAFVPKGVPCKLLPNLAMMPPEDFRYSGRQEKLLITVGLMGHIPNSEGVGWFLKNIWPEFHAKYPEFKYAIAGGGLPLLLKEEWSKLDGVEVLGFVKDLDELYERAYAVVATILTGAGTCIKVIEATLRGRKTFATRNAARGNENLCGVEIFESAASFINGFSGLREMPESSRSAEQEAIASDANKRNSFHDFANTVSSLIHAKEKV